MTQLYKLAKLIRSKNAGPFELTFDIMFESQEIYDRVVNAGVITKALVADIYKLPNEKVKLFFCPNAHAIKATIPRPYVQGDPRCSDSHGGQQYAPLMAISIP
jgi:hypothetical protein